MYYDCCYYCRYSNIYHIISIVCCCSCLFVCLFLWWFSGRLLFPFLSALHDKAHQLPRGVYYFNLRGGRFLGQDYTIISLCSPVAWNTVILLAPLSSCFRHPAGWWPWHNSTLSRNHMTQCEQPRVPQGISDSLWRVCLCAGVVLYLPFPFCIIDNYLMLFVITSLYCWWYSYFLYSRIAACSLLW